MGKKYEFEWKNTNRLRYISDKDLEIAYKLLKGADSELSYSNNRIYLNSNVMSLCNFEYTTDELLKGLQENNKIRNNSIFTKNNNEFNINVRSDIEITCKGCKFDRCPKKVMAYIKYLKENGELEAELKDREEFRNKNTVNDVFTYTWEIEEGLKNTPDNVYEFCKQLVDNGYIDVSRSLNIDGNIEILSVLSCKDYRNIDFDKSKITEKIGEISNYTVLKRKTNQEKMYFCDTYSCRLIKCPYLVAGYIFYLQRTGQYEKIEADRKYYKENKEKIDKELLQLKNKEIERFETNKNNYITELQKYEGKTDNIQDIIEDIITNKTQDVCNCIIEGEDEELKKEIIDYIEKTLINNGKIERGATKRISLQNLASQNVHATSTTFGNYGKDGKFYPERDENGEEYISYNEVKYTEIKKGRLYILNKVQEFVEDYKKYAKDEKYLYNELRYKQFNHVINILTKMEKGDYIIINGTKEEIDNLLEIDPRLQFIYQNYRYTFKGLTIDEIFELFINNIRPELIDDLKANKAEYEKQFKEYYSLNKKFIPFSNRDLASYLAMYCNSKGKIVFPENMYRKETVEESLNKIVGLETLKENIKKFESYMLFQIKAKSNGIKLASTNMHMVFTGNPGTGKTTIARIMAKMLFDLGIIKENKLIEVERKDLIAGYIGQTAAKTTEVIEKAMGGVLFIDEAYSLVQNGVSNDFGQEAIATLIKAMEDHKGEFVVIFAGYRDEMKTFIDINPGIASRIGYTFDFPDYSISELTQIFYIKMKNMGFECDEEIDKKIKNICTYFSRRKAFGNGRFIDKLTQEIIMKHALNADENINRITIEDIPEIEELNNYSAEEKESVDDLLKNIIGMDSVKQKIKDFSEYAKFIKKAENTNISIPNQNMHMIFTGNPGTGKTTIARVMAKMLFDLGIIKENKLIEVERKDLIAGYIGQTATKTTEVIEKAMGGVLFIDEAYSLVQNGVSNDFGQEAIATLIKAMEDHKGEFVVIFAGYREEMKDFIDSNPGIASRIGYTFDFQDYTPEELAEILYRKIAQCNLKISEEAKQLVNKLMKYFGNVENIGNGRFSDKVLQEILLKHSKNKNKDITLIDVIDIPTINEMTKVVFNGNAMINPEKITKKDLKRTAIHEVGHAVVRLLLFKKSGIKKITINPEGTGTLGYVEHEITEGYVRTKTQILNEVKVLLAGMVSEQKYLGEFANGNSSDLEKATKLVKNMITISGMSKIGLGQIKNENGELSKIVQDEINNILGECFNETLKLVEDNSNKIEKVVEYLLEHKEISEKELVENFK